MRRSESRAIFLCERLVVDGFDGLAELVGEVFDEGVEFGFELLGAGLLFHAAFDFEAGFFAGEFSFALLQGFAFGGGGGELVVELVEEGADVCGLRGHLGAGCGDDLGWRPRRLAMLRPAEAPGTPRRSS